jgi:Zn-finger nucleic acid-binding protein
MPLPQCPSCREKMSATEYGHYGAYICFYCDGTWLPGTAVEKLLVQFPNAPSLSHVLQASAGEMWAVPTLSCPACGINQFRRFSKAGAEINLCSGCAGMFFAKGAFAISFPEATSDSFPRGAVGGAIAAESIFWAALLFFAGLR